MWIGIYHYRDLVRGTKAQVFTHSQHFPFHPTSQLLLPLLHHLDAFLLVSRSHYDLTLLAAIPSDVTIATALGRRTNLFGTVGIRAGLGGPVAWVADHTSFVFMKPCNTDAINAKIVLALVTMEDVGIRTGLGRPVAPVANGAAAILAILVIPMNNIETAKAKLFLACITMQQNPLIQGMSDGTCHADSARETGTHTAIIK